MVLYVTVIQELPGARVRVDPVLVDVIVMPMVVIVYREPVHIVLVIQEPLATVRLEQFVTVTQEH